MQIKKILAFISALTICCSISLTPQVADTLTSIVASAEDEVIGHAYLSFSNGITEQWEAGVLGDAVEITGNGDYSLSLDFDESQASDMIDILFISTDINVFTEDENGNQLYDDMTFSINSIYVDGNEIEYTGPSDGAHSLESNGVDYRFNIYNVWGNDVEDINPNVVNSSNITVNFSVTGIKNAESLENQYSDSYDENDIPEVQTILDTAELTPHDTIYCYDCSSDMNSTDIMYTYKITENDKQILQNFIDENFTDDMCNTEKIQYTMDWLHNNITYTLSEDYFKLPNSLAECGFVEKAGQCLQYNGALAYMLAYMGYDTNLIFLKSGSWQHFTCQVRIDGKVYRMEAGNKGLDDGSHYMYQTFLSLETDVNVDENTIIGQLNKNTTYSFDKSTGVLTISGIGDMYCDLDNYWQFYNGETDETEDFSKDIKSVIIEDGIISTGYNAFWDCTSLENVTLPDSLLFVGGFINCTSLKNIIIPNSVTYISNFSGCTSLTNITIPNSVTEIEVGAFEGCTSLTEVTIPSNVTYIGDYALGYYLDEETYEYKKLENFTIYGAKGSEAETYATENGFNFVSTGEDVSSSNENSKITQILKLKKYILGISTDDTDLDFNSDDSINILDLIIALNNLIK